MSISCINFAKATGHSSSHNLREDEPSYLLPKEHRLQNESWRHKHSDHRIFMIELEKANRLGGPKPKLENSRWEAVLNLNRNHTMDDVKKVAAHLEKEFNVTVSEITIHRDEGVMENGIPVHNFHAHINFVTYKDGQQNWRLTHIKKKMTPLQTKVAEILKMERGRSKEETGRVHLKPKEYKAKMSNEAEKNRKIEVLKITNQTMTSTIEWKNQQIEMLKKRNEMLDTVIAELRQQNEALRTHLNQKVAQNLKNEEKINPDASKRLSAREIYEQKLAERGLSEKSGLSEKKSPFQKLQTMKQNEIDVNSLFSNGKSEAKKEEEPQSQKKRGWFR